MPLLKSLKLKTKKTVRAAQSTPDRMKNVEDKINFQEKIQNITLMIMVGLVVTLFVAFIAATYAYFQMNAEAYREYNTTLRELKTAITPTPIPTFTPSSTPTQIPVVKPG